MLNLLYDVFDCNESGTHLSSYFTALITWVIQLHASLSLDDEK